MGSLSCPLGCQLLAGKPGAAILVPICFVDAGCWVLGRHCGDVRAHTHTHTHIQFSFREEASKWADKVCLAQSSPDILVSSAYCALHNLAKPFPHSIYHAQD